MSSFVHGVDGITGMGMEGEIEEAVHIYYEDTHNRGAGAAALEGR